MINKSVLHKILFIAVGIILSLVVLEASLQTAAAVRSVRKNNSNIESMRNGGTFRILCLGESTTDGQYPRQLEEILNAKNTGVKFQVIDEGHGATNTDFILANLDYYLTKYKPDMAITMMGVNDNREDLTVYEYKPASWYKTFRTYKILKILKFRISAKLIELKTMLLKIMVHCKRLEYIDPAVTKAQIKHIDKNTDLINESIYFKKGRAYREQKKYNEAEAVFRKLVELNSKNDQAYIFMGDIFKAQQKYEDAVQMYRKAIELNPKLDWTHIAIIDIYRIQRKYKEAEAEYRKTIELNPNNEITYVTIGDIYKEQAQYKEAEVTYRKAIALNPKADWIFAKLNNLYMLQKKYNDATAMFIDNLTLRQRIDGMEEVQFIPKHLNGIEANDNKYYGPKTQYNYCKLKNILNEKHIKLVCVQYPLRELRPLKEILEPNEGIVFVDNEKCFKGAVAREGYNTYFIDTFSSDFGHCTYKGNKLLAENIASVIIKKYFYK